MPFQTKMICQLHTLTVNTFALGRTGSGTKLAKRLAKGRPCSTVDL